MSSDPIITAVKIWVRLPLDPNTKTDEEVERLHNQIPNLENFDIWEDNWEVIVWVDSPDEITTVYDRIKELCK